MKRRRRVHARAITFALFAIAIGLALVLFPLRAGSAASNGEAGATKTQGGATRHKTTRASLSRAGAEAAGEAVGEAPTAALDKVDGDAGATASTTKESANKEVELSSIPVGRGLPVLVNVGVFFVDLVSFDDTKGDFECTTDVRLRWTDTRLRFASSDAVRGFKEYRGKEVEELLTKIWTPTLDVTNRVESSSYVGRRIRIFPNGQVEQLTRMTASYKGHLDPETFPFDRQGLTLDIVVREDTTDEVLLRFDREDVQFSRASKKAKLDGWNVRHVDLQAKSIAGWNGDRYSRMTASLFIDRVWTTSLAPIFIPLLASLLIPLLSIWMNKATDDGFEVDAFELANIGIGGLFSVIALSFAIYSSYGVIANSDNTVTRLFGLNYAMLAITLTIVVVCFRYDMLARLFSQHVQRETFQYLMWSLPLLSMAISVAFLLVAAA